MLSFRTPTYTLTIVAFVAAVAAAVADAQSGQTTPPPQQPIGRPGGTPGVITVSGCVQSDRSPAAGTTGTASASTPSYGESDFVLRTDRSSSTGASASTATTTGTSTSSYQAMYYKLTGTDTGFSAHVGQRVEITGEVVGGDSGTASSGSSSAGSTSSASSSSSGSTANAPRLKVTRVRTLSGSCDVSG